jgi:mono/diheme cytochrome c family protein
MRVHAIVPLAAALALGTALVVERSSSKPRTEQGLVPVLGRVEVLRDAYSEWKEAQGAIGGSRSIVLGLEWTRAFATADRTGGGRAQLDLVEGTIDVEVQGLCDGEPLDFWIVQNVEGADRSVAPEAGDRMVRLGRFVDAENGRILRSRIPDDLLGNFTLDLAVVTRAGVSPAEEGLLFGTPDLFQRLYSKEIQARQNVKRIGDESGLLLALVAPVEDGSGSDDDLSALVALGEKLFFNGTFSGNGRTCGTCHPATNNLTLDPEFIATLPESDPLFIGEDRPGHPFPSLVFGTPQSFGRRFENPVLMRGQALIVENVDGFAPFIGPGPAVDRFALRGVPHVFAQRVSIRAPGTLGGPPLPKERTGWSGDGSPFLDPQLPGSNGTLRFFAAGAVRQHFTRDIRRRPGIDFTFPTDAELDAMEAFQLTLGRQQELDLATLVLLDVDADTGRDLFLNSRCNKCHGNAGAGSAGTQDPNGVPINENFNTGVERFLTNNPDDTGEPRPPDGGFGTNPQGDFTSLVANADPTDGIFGNKQFNTVSLVEMADTLPAFHNNITSIAGSTALENTVEGAILFYRTPEFDQSPSGPAISFGGQGTEQVGKFLRVINALHNKDEAYQRAKLAHHLLSGVSFDPAVVNQLLRVAVADSSDGIEVLLPVGLHPIARADFENARQQFEGAMAGSAATRQAKIIIGLDALNHAEDDMRGP